MSVKVSGIADGVAYATKDLADEPGMDRNGIKIAESGAATWPDASLGLPEPGKMYARALCEGFRVVLEAGGKKYEYRFGNGQVKVHGPLMVKALKDKGEAVSKTFSTQQKY